MIYLNDLSATVSVPRHTQDVSSAYTLVLTSNLSDSVALINSGSNVSTNSLYYKFPIDENVKLNVGEYTYTLYDDSENVLEQGLLTYGAYSRQVIVNNTTNEKIQYNG